MRIMGALAAAITICATSASGQVVRDSAGVGVVEAAARWWSSGLRPLVLDGHELHATLVTQRIEDVLRLHVPRAVLRENPMLSTDADFVEAIARSGSQGRLGAEGIRAALYALYRGESEIGLYGLEAASTADADRREGLLREIWAHNASLDRARVHRRGKVLVVVWNNGVPASIWEAVNAVVVERLAVP
jgi:hypothetical protein